jgi:hypothetical protein
VATPALPRYTAFRPLRPGRRPQLSDAAVDVVVDGAFVPGRPEITSGNFAGVCYPAEQQGREPCRAGNDVVRTASRNV